MLTTLNKLVKEAYDNDLRYTLTSDTMQFRAIPQHKAAYIQGLADAVQALSNSETHFECIYDVSTNRFTVTER